MLLSTFLVNNGPWHHSGKYTVLQWDSYTAAEHIPPASTSKAQHLSSRRARSTVVYIHATSYPHAPLCPYANIDDTGDVWIYAPIVIHPGGASNIVVTPAAFAERRLPRMQTQPLSYGHRLRTWPD